MKKKTYEFFINIGRLCFKKPTIYLPEDFDASTPSIFLCNHAKNYGPVITITRFPVTFRPWCHSGVVHSNESFEYIRNGFFMERLKLNKKIAGFFARLINKPLLALVHMNRPITAYHDISKCLKTINMGTQSLLNGENQLIFSNVPIRKGGTLNPDFDFMKGYLLVIKKAMKNGVIPKIYPVSINKQKATISIGDPISPDPQVDWNMEKRRINAYLVRKVKLGYVYPARTLEVVNSPTIYTEAKRKIS
jgi:hypothetical protein